MWHIKLRGLSNIRILRQLIFFLVSLIFLVILIYWINHVILIQIIYIIYVIRYWIYQAILIVDVIWLVSIKSGGVDSKYLAFRSFSRIKFIIILLFECLISCRFSNSRIAYFIFPITAIERFAFLTTNIGRNIVSYIFKLVGFINV